jgi:hypothetical protein
MTKVETQMNGKMIGTLLDKHASFSNVKSISSLYYTPWRLDSIDTDSNCPQNHVLSVDGAHISEPISSHQSENVS